MTNDFNAQIIDEFRANGGRVGGPFEGARLLLLTTTGARSGTPHTTPLGYLPDGDRILVIASAAGADRHPDWFHNLRSNPTVTIEDGAFTYDARAIVLVGDERDRIFARAAEAEPGWADYQAKTSRVIPVVALEEIPGPPRFNATSPGGALKAIHDAFRRELGIIRREVAGSGRRIGAQLRVNCLTVCQGLHGHHRNEDAGMLPAIAAQRPDLAPTIDRLSDEHRRIAALLDELAGVLAAEDGTPEQLRADVDRLVDQLEAHLAYEEEQLIPVLDASMG